MKNIRATSVLNKNNLRKCAIIGEKQLQKKKQGNFEPRISNRKSSATLTVVGWLQQQQSALHNFFWIFWT